MENSKRSRNSTLSIRLSKAEKELIKSKAKRQSASLTDYILTVILKNESESNEVYKELMKLLKAVTKLLAEISDELKKAKQRSIDYEDVKDMQVEIKALIIELLATKQRG